MKTIDKITSAAILATALGMVAWSFFTGPGQGPLLAVAGILVVAAGIILLIGKGKEYASERGITLQTLIVTAVLVLMAGAAGVVIIAITNSAQDDLENQSSDINARCQPWEIFDPTLDAAGRGGGNGGIDSSGSGCVRVCYVKSKAGSTLPVAADLSATGDRLIMSRSNASKPRNEIATTSNTDNTTATLVNAKLTGEVVLPVVEDRAVGIQVAHTKTGGSAKSSLFTSAVLSDDNQRIEVSPNQRYCRVWDDTNDQEVASLRSN